MKKTINIKLWKSCTSNEVWEERMYYGWTKAEKNTAMWSEGDEEMDRFERR